MSVYNGARFLREAIDSILRQTLSDFEFLIVNDGSTDGSTEILKSFTDPRIRLLTNESNIGLTKSLNRGLAEARGKYIARMDCDDVSLPQRLEQQVAFLEANPEYGVVGCGFQIINAEGEPQYAIEFSAEHNFLRWYLCFQNPIVHPAALLRREFLTKINGYDTKFIYAQDYDLWWRASWVCQFSVLPAQLFQLRRHKDSLTNQHLTEQMKLAGQVRREMIPRFLGHAPTPLGDGADFNALNKPGHAKLIEELYQQATSSNLSPVEQEMIRKDAAARLAILFLRWPFDARAVRALMTALAMDWLVVPRIMTWPIARFVFKRVHNPILFCA